MVNEEFFICNEIRKIQNPLINADLLMTFISNNKPTNKLHPKFYNKVFRDEGTSGAWWVSDDVSIRRKFLIYCINHIDVKLKQINYYDRKRINK
jgi:hypothetical protein